MMHFPKVPVVIVSALSKKDRAIGYQNKLLWHIPEDLKRFKSLTTGHPIIMGRKTLDSIVEILGKPLPGRINIVITRNPDYAVEGAETAGSLEAAFAIAERENPSEIHIGGGSEIYNAAMPYVNRLHLTLVDSVAQADSFFPEYEKDFVVTKEYPIQEYQGTTYKWVDYERKET